MTRLAAVVACCFATVATAAEPPAFLKVSDVGKDTITIEKTVLVQQPETKTVIKMVDGKPVTETVTVMVTMARAVSEQMSTTGAKLTTLDGKEAEWEKAKGKIILSSQGPLDEAYRKLFAADVLVMIRAK